jgi:ligand-binding sensor domain-containing protein/tRNA A-37 threonylcarbamoyl transferase component Bud32
MGDSMPNAINKKKSITFSFIIFFFFCVHTLALELNCKITQYILDKWSVEQGLTLSTVNALYQSENGYIWIGTDKGLVRFNGTEFYTINKENSVEVEIRTITEDNEGKILVGTYDSKIMYLDNNTLKPFKLNSKINSPMINKIIIKDNSIWIAGSSGLELAKNNKVVQVWPKVNSKDNMEIASYAMDMTFDNQNNLLCGLDGGGTLLTVDSNLVIKEYKLSNNSRELINCINIDNTGNIWIGTDFEGIFLFNKGKFVKPSFANKLKSKQINSILCDTDGNLWIASSGGLYKWNGNTLDLINKRKGLPVNFANKLLEDKEGSIWIGTRGGGLARLKNSLFKCFSTKEGLSGDIVFPIMEDSQERIWAGTYGHGVNIVENNRVVKTYTQKNGLTSDYIRTILQDKNKMWVGTHNGFNLINLKNGKITNFAKGREIHVMYLSKDNTLWVGTTLGILQVKKNRLLKEKDFEQWGLKGSFITDFLEIEKGKLLVATLAGGLHLIENNKVTKYFTKQDGLPEKRLHSLFLDNEKNLWIASYNGIYLMHKGKFHHIATKNGLKERICYGITNDSKGYLWFTGNSGVYKAKNSEMKKIIYNPDVKINVKVYGNYSGLRSFECNGIFQPCILKRKNGNIVVPTIKGFAEINPSQSFYNKLPPNVVIEKIKANGKEFKLSNNITFPMRSKNFEFSYAALSYLFPEKVLYKYKITDLDTNWYFAGTRKTAYFNELPSGKHTLQVIACNNDGVWNKKGAFINFYIKPQIREMWWFKLLILLFVVVTGNLTYKFIKKTVKQFLKWKKQQLFGHYRIIEKLGSGGMGEVFKAEHLEFNEQVALKLMQNNFVEKEEKERFLREGKITALVSHPNVVKIIEVGEISGRLFYSMDLVLGITLRELMKNELTVSQVLAFAKNIFEILNFFHNKAVIHRDIKPENIMIYLSEKETLEKAVATESENDFFSKRIRILDFGVAKLTTLSTLTKTGMVQGTFLYQPPETFDGKTKVQPYFDFYAIGIILYEMLCKKIPFKGENPMEIVFSKISSDPIPILDQHKEIPFEVADFVMWLIDRNPDARLKDFSEIIQELNNITKKIRRP